MQYQSWQLYKERQQIGQTLCLNNYREYWLDGQLPMTGTFKVDLKKDVCHSTLVIEILM